ncbi:MAG TPA: flagellar biosynthetic protein FliO [Stellaceae bacterium]|nr:flagellar biosynthetic protein FliO [Stellaceae bacterium]
MDSYARFLLALAFVVALIAACAWLARRYAGGGMLVRRGATRRLSIVEVTSIDAKRRLVLLRRDGVEHLVLLGPGQDVVIERGIPADPADPNTSFAAHLAGGAS